MSWDQALTVVMALVVFALGSFIKLLGEVKRMFQDGTNETNKKLEKLSEKMDTKVGLGDCKDNRDRVEQDLRDLWGAVGSIRGGPVRGGDRDSS